jgi:hypothetical protein
LHLLVYVPPASSLHPLRLTEIFSDKTTIIDLNSLDHVVFYTDETCYFDVGSTFLYGIDDFIS